MTYTIRNAIGSNAKPLVGLYAESGCGKTYSSLLLAKGFAGDMSRVVMIETESGRGEAWADDAVVGGYKIISLRSDFSPRAYGGAISAAEEFGALVLIVDSASHEWEGVGGVLDMANKNEEGGRKGPLVWQKPKMDHQREFMLRITQTPIPLVVVCMRAKYVMEPISGTKDWKRSKDLSPKQSDDILSEMFVHGWIDRDRHAFRATKYTVDTMRPVFVDGEPIAVETGKRLAAWAARPKSTPAANPTSAHPAPAGEGAAGVDFITPDQVIYLGDRCRENSIDVAKLLDKSETGAKSLATLPADKYKASCDWIDAVLQAREQRKATT
jgi:hypothetical protein